MYTDKELDRRRKLVYEVRPWEKSSGPKTPRGKRVSSMNALKHGLHSRDLALRTCSVILEQQKAVTESALAWPEDKLDRLREILPETAELLEKARNVSTEDS